MHHGSNDEGNEDVEGGDGESIVDCGNDVHGDSGDKNNSDGVDDCGVNINGGDSIGDGGVDTNGGSNPDFGDDKTKVVCSGDTAGDDGNSNHDGGPNDDGGVDTNDNDCDGDDADTDGDNNDNVADGEKNEPDGGSNDEGGGGDDEGSDNADGNAKDVSRDDCDNKDDIDFESDDGVRDEFLQSNSISTIFDANL